MTDTDSSAVAAPSSEAPAKGGEVSTWRRFLGNRLAAAGLAIVSAVVLLAVLAPILPIPSPAATDLSARLQSIGTPGHPLGTDKLGRDILARLIWGGRVSLLIGLLATAVAALVGSTVGLISGFFRGPIDNALMRSIDVLMAFPYLLLAIALVAFLGPGLLKAMIAVAVVNIPFFARAVRGATLGVMSNEYVEAAALAGRNRLLILFAEVLPNVFSTILITTSTTVGWMITETAGLSFLGLGAQPPTSDWGTMLGDGRELLTFAPHVSLIPGLAIFLVVISLNFMGDGLRDALDPRLS
ncbi:hypothetical protein BH23ACT11_BH23ACT11_22940 [soil metagenome]